MIRSVDDWSAGITKTETSILNAYCDLIKQAEHYIYIEVRFIHSEEIESKAHFACLLRINSSSQPQTG